MTNKEYKIISEAIKNVSRHIKESFEELEDSLKSEIIENLSDEQEEKLREKHAEVYSGTDDDMPDAFDNWLEDLTIEELTQ